MGPADGSMAFEGEHWYGGRMSVAARRAPKELRTEGSRVGSFDQNDHHVYSVMISGVPICSFKNSQSAVSILAAVCVATGASVALS